MLSNGEIKPDHQYIVKGVWGKEGLINSYFKNTQPINDIYVQNILLSCIYVLV